MRSFVENLKLVGFLRHFVLGFGETRKLSWINEKEKQLLGNMSLINIGNIIGEKIQFTSRLEIVIDI